MGPMEFQGVTVHVGDIVAFNPLDAMFPVDEAVVLNVDRKGNLGTFCPILSQLGRDGYLSPAEVTNFRVVTLAADAIPIHSGDQRFAKNELVVSKIHAKKYPGQYPVVAALDGVVFFTQGKGPYIAHMAHNLERVEMPATT